jgi:hypothetical protein
MVRWGGASVKEIWVRNVNWNWSNGRGATKPRGNILENDEEMRKGKGEKISQKPQNFVQNQGNKLSQF